MLNNLIDDDNGPSRFISGRETKLLNNNNQFLSAHVYLDDNDVLRCAPDFNIEDNLDEVSNLINAYDTYLRRMYHRKMRYFKGDHQLIRDRARWSQLDDEKNRVVINVAKNLVNTFNGFFIGVPPKITYAPNQAKDSDQEHIDQVNDQVSQALSDSDSDDVFYELSKCADIYGRGYLVAYLADDDERTLKFTHKSPENAFVVYSNDNEQKPLFSMTFDNVNGGWFGSLYTDTNIYKFTSADLASNVGFKKSVTNNGGLSTNPLGMEPITELPENNERMGIYDDLVSLIDAQDKIMSEKVDDNDNFSNAILYTQGVKTFNPRDRAAIKRWRVMQVNTETAASNDVDVHYLQKPDADTLQENTLKHLSEKIYDGAQVVNLNDPNLGAAASGFALTQRMQPMEMLASTKGEKMRKTIKRLLTIILTNGEIDAKTTAELVRGFKVEFTPNIPHSDVDESNIVKNLNGIISQRLLLSYLSKVGNIDDEIKEEQKDKAKNMENFDTAGGQPPQANGDYPPELKSKPTEDPDEDRPPKPNVSQGKGGDDK